MIESEDLFMGKNGYYWFFGTIEDNGDPLGLGRCRVRITGWHNDDPYTLPTSSLPWAYPIKPISDSAIAGIGHSNTGPLPGTRVLGFFLDGLAGQQPIIYGTIPGESETVFKRKLEYGSTPWMPFIDNLLYPNANKEDDSPQGDIPENSNTNELTPDPRTVIPNSGEWVLPCTGFVSSAYGERGGRHNGVDICPAGYYMQTDAGAKHLNGRLRGPVGNPVYAAADGKVIHIWKSDIGQGGISTEYDKYGPNSGNSRSFGNAIAIQHSLSSGSYVTIYAHLGQSQDPANDIPGAGIMVSLGDIVSKGQQIGTMGRSHCWDALTHLHFEIRVGTSLPKCNNHINPGRIFPSLNNRHGFARSWAESQKKYNVKALPFKVNEAPVIALSES